jgi:hypothetical protein
MSHLNMLKRLAIILIAARDSLWLGRAGRSSQGLSVLLLCVFVAWPGLARSTLRNRQKMIARGGTISRRSEIGALT